MVEGAETIKKYFPDISESKLETLSALKPLYEEWNAKINVISRKDMDGFFARHVLHSLAISFYWKPKKDIPVIDIGTGGGFPGIPLAIMFPDTPFLLVDSIGKKIKVVEEVAAALDLKNVTARKARAEEVSGQFQMAVTRAVAKLEVLTDWCVRGKFKTPGIYCLKGGDLTEEIDAISKYPVVEFGLQSKFDDPFFETKKVVFAQYA